MIVDLGLFGFLGILSLLFGYIFKSTKNGNILTLIGSSFLCYYSFCCGTHLYSILFFIWVIVVLYNLLSSNENNE